MPLLTNDCVNELNRAIPLTNYLTRSTKYPKEYGCPFCGSSHHVEVYPGNNIGHCAKCGRSFNLIQAMQELEGLDFMDAARTISDQTGTPLEYEEKTTPQKAQNGPKQDAGNKTPAENQKALKTENTAPAEETERKPNKPGLYKDFILKAAADLYGPDGIEALDYLHNRGLNDETIKKYKLGYSKDEVYFTKAKGKLPAIIFPHDGSYSYYSARSLTDKYFSKPNADEAGAQPLYNPAALTIDRPCFICEGQIDALSIIQSGGNAAALCGVGLDVLTDYVTKNPPEKALILSLDNDAPDQNGKRAGQDMQASLAAELDERNIDYINASFSRRYRGITKDANDLLRADPAQLQRDVQQNEKQAVRKAAFIPYKMSDYLTGGGFSADIDYFKRYQNRGTGFKNLDRYLTLYPGTAAIGGAASLGKTTFCVNLAYNLVEAGETVLYFSLEQEPIEIATKILARRLYETDPNTPLTNVDIKNGATCDALDEARADCAKNADRFIIVRCNFTTTAENIRDYVQNFIGQTGTRPVVFVDYLQLVSPPDDYKGDTRGGIDNIIKTFKMLQTDNELFLVLVSSYNRANYETPASYEDFKESGMIEYTCDYVWALQLSIMETSNFYYTKGAKGGIRETTKKEKADAVNAELSKDVRPVEFVSLKSRNGKQRYEAFFKYDVKHDCFIPTAGTEYAKDPERAAREFSEAYPNNSPAADIEFKKLTSDQKTIFD